MTEEKKKITKEELKEYVKEMIGIYKGLPMPAKLTPVTHADLENILPMFLAILEVV